MRATDTPARGGAGGQTSPPGSGPRHALRPQSRPGVGPWLLLPDRFRPRTVRAKIVSLLMVPVISLMALWAFATVTTARSVSEVDRLKEVNATLLAPVGGYVTAVQGERAAAVRYLAAPSTDRKAAYDDRRKGTDAAAVALRDGVNAGSTDAPAIDPDLPGRIDRLMNDADRLAETRKQVDARGADRERTFTAYTETVDHAFAVSGALTSVQNTEVSSETRVVLELQQARELIAREDALLGAAQAAGRMSAADHTRFAGAVQAQRMTFGSAVDDLRPEDADAYRKVLASEAYQDLRSAEDAVLRAGSAAPTAVPAARWSDANRTVAQDLSRAEAGASTAAAAGADTFSLDVLGGSGLAVVLGLAGVLLSLFISVRIGRGLVVELVELRNSALQLAGRELPRTMRRLHAGEDVDIDAEAPVRKHGDDEVGQVGAALDAVHRAALTAAAERAEVLSGISGVYVNLARRSQVLLHRQLGLLDTMERRTEDPTDLEDLFRLDHLTTRMRRHAESLIILSGAAPGRGWRNPVPLLDVVRAAVAEVEDFPRVEVRGVPEVRLSGTAVADITHLIAELVENAVAFSPPHTKVTVRGEQVGAGLVLEIEDRGLGMGRDVLAEANRRIEDAGQVDLLDSQRLGLYVVNRLAHRQNIGVSLRSSAYGGVTAVVLVPEKLLVAEDAAAESGPGAQDAPAGPRVADGRERDARSGHTTRVEDVRNAARAVAARRPRALESGPRALESADRGRQDRAEAEPGTPAPAAPETPPAAPASPEQRRRLPEQRRPLPEEQHPAQPHPADAEPGPGPLGAVGHTPPPGRPAAPDDASASVHPLDAGRRAPGAGDPRAGHPQAGSPQAPGATRIPGRQPAPHRAPALHYPPAPAHAPEPPRAPVPRTAPEDNGDEPPLPRRVRQASLAPELRENRLAGPDPSAQRTPEGARATMAALRAGWARGRTSQHPSRGEETR